MSNLDFGPVVLGTNVFGWTADEETSHAILDAFADAGGTWIDTADVYSTWGGSDNVGGESETIIGSWFAKPGNRDRLKVATKVAKWDRHPGLSPENIAAALDDSLTRLHTDHIDLYYAHEDDESVRQEDYVRTFDSAVKDGKVGLVGASNFTPERLEAAVKIAKNNGLTPFAVSEDQYNLVERGYESTVRPVVQALDLVELPYYSLASGFLTGKYQQAGARPASVRSSSVATYLSQPWAGSLFDALSEIAAVHGTSITAVSLAWLRQQPTVGAPIASARTVDQLQDIVDSFSLVLDDAEVERLSAITA